jgi:hypothetical protein
LNSNSRSGQFLLLNPIQGEVLQHLSSRSGKSFRAPEIHLSKFYQYLSDIEVSTAVFKDKKGSYLQVKYFVSQMVILVHYHAPSLPRIKSSSFRSFSCTPNKFIIILGTILIYFKPRKQSQSVSTVSNGVLVVTGEKVCVQCDNEAMRPSLGYRCTGHGTMDRTTRWATLTASHCHGKWVRMDSSPLAISAGSPSNCPVCPKGVQFVFV